jgi:hypothetical protein
MSFEFPLNTNRLVITGLEGCGKSSQLFCQISQDATGPILIGVKNYALMQEQINNWSQRYQIPLKEFAICSRNSKNEEIAHYLTDYENPFILPSTAKYIFTSQANIQRNNHLDFIHPDGTNVKWNKIIIDEFDFCSGIIPSLDYELGRISDGKSKDYAISRKLDWIQKNYTFRDRIKTHIAKTSKEFHIAEWIDNCPCPLIFLTSELLSTQILEAMGFAKFELPQRDFKHCKVNVATFSHINNQLFEELNKNNAWNEFKDYDLIITDKVKSYYEKLSNEEQTLEVKVLSHTSVRGSNEHKDKKILTILSYIPSSTIQLILDCLIYLGVETDYKQVESLYYRDRLCQSIGRTLGYRGGTECDVIIHSQILDSLSFSFFPYSLNQFLQIKNSIFHQCIEEAIIKTRQNRLQGLMKDDDYSFLKHFFKYNKDSVIPVKEVKKYLKSQNIKSKTNRSIPATTIAREFETCVRTRRVEGKRVSCLVGLEFTK